MYLHQRVLTISYEHRYQIRRLFKEVLGLYDIDHFSLDLVSPAGEMIFFSGTPSHGYEICSKGLGEFDGAISPEYYQQYEFYWWKDVVHKRFGEQINYIRDVKHQFRHGFMLVRHWNDFYLIYSFATKSNKANFQSTIINNVNHLLSVGDYLYNSMRDVYAEYSGAFTPPKITQFYPFQGGKPVARYDDEHAVITSQVVQHPLRPVVRAPQLKLIVNHNHKVDENKA